MQTQNDAKTNDTFLCILEYIFSVYVYNPTEPFHIYD